MKLKILLQFPACPLYNYHLDVVTLLKKGQSEQKQVPLGSSKI